MKVFADFHHSGLYESLRLLFEKRLGWELYRPIGLDWFHEGFWEIARPYGNAIETVNQYLNTENIGEYDAYKALNGQNYRQDGVFYVYDGFHDSWHKAITLEKFKTMKFDIILASITEHEAPYKRLRDTYQPQAKLVAQIGNVGQKPTGEIPNILDSTAAVPQDSGNVVSYHQEFDLSKFNSEIPYRQEGVVSLMHLLPATGAIEDWKKIPEPKFMYGVGTELGALSSLTAVGNAMADTRFVFHAKRGGDGYGHIFHNAYAAGRPVITYGSAYQGKQGGKLFEDRVTGIDLEKPDWLDFLSNLSDEQYSAMSMAARKRFDEFVNFDNEEKDIRGFLERLQ